MYVELKNKGIRFHRDPLLRGEEGEGLAGHRYVYLRGLDDEILEFIQPP